MKILKSNQFFFCFFLLLALLTVPAFAYESGDLYASYCSKCGKYLDFVLDYQSKEPTCTSGSYWYGNCSVCGNRVAMGMHDRLGGEHVWAEISRIAATCTVAGKINYTCSRCNDTKSEALPALEHNWTETRRTPATCITAGTIYYSCSRCDETKMETIPQLAEDHTWTESARTPATCTAAGKVD